MGNFGGSLNLTPRQTQILRLISRGVTDKEIASTLGISVKTVQTHLYRLYRKLGVTNRAHAVTLWLHSQSDESHAAPEQARRESTGSSQR
jgi:DNA-binding CsgD family transcriptional regulator